MTRLSLALVALLLFWALPARVLAAYDGGFNFRFSSGYVTDGANETYVVFVSSYPTTRNGFTFGWTVGPTLSNDVSTTYPRLAGYNGAAVGDTWQLDLPAAGAVTVHLALGSAGGGGCATETVALKDNATTLHTYGPFDATVVDRLMDANDVQHTSSANWIANETGATFTFATTTLKLVFSSCTGVIAHLRVVQSSGAPARSLMRLGVGR